MLRDDPELDMKHHVSLLTYHGDPPGGGQSISDCLCHGLTGLREPVLGPEKWKDQLVWELSAIEG